MIKNVPNKIFLVTGYENDSENADIEFKELTDVTWSETPIFDNDIEYVRREPINWEQQRIKAAMFAMQSLMRMNADVAFRTGNFSDAATLASTAVSYADALITELKK